MKKKLTVSAGSVMLIKDRENMLEQYDSITFNSGSVVITQELNAKAQSANIVFNSGNVRVIDTPKNPVLFNGRLTLDKAGEHQGEYVICDEAVITKDGAQNVSGLEGMIVRGKLYYAESIGAQVAGVQAKRRIAYTDGSVLITEETELKAESSRHWEDNTHYYIAATVFATEGELLKDLKGRGITFYCDKLYIAEQLYNEYKSIFTSDQILIVPQGYAIVRKSAPLIDLYATYGEKIYLLDKLTVQPRNAKDISLFTSIIVKGTADLPRDHFAALKAVIQADTMRIFEGELIKVEGFQIISKAMLVSAAQAGIRYTLKVDGAALIEDGVTAEEIKVIAALTVDGIISAPSVTHAHLNAVAAEIDGMLLGSLPEIKAMLETMPGNMENMLGGMLPAQLLSLLGIDQDEGANSSINTGSYVLI